MKKLSSLLNKYSSINNCNTPSYYSIVTSIIYKVGGPKPQIRNTSYSSHDHHHHRLIPRLHHIPLRHSAFICSLWYFIDFTILDHYPFYAAFLHDWWVWLPTFPRASEFEHRRCLLLLTHNSYSSWSPWMLFYFHGKSIISFIFTWNSANFVRPPVK